MQRGFVPMESYPARCNTPDGRSFTQTLSSDEDKNRVCIQVITPAKNPKTGECKDYPNPCVVPEGWEKVTNCPNADILFDHECKVGKDNMFPGQCPKGYKCAFTGEYPDEINNLGHEFRTSRLR